MLAAQSASRRFSSRSREKKGKLRKQAFHQQRQLRGAFTHTDGGCARDGTNPVTVTVKETCAEQEAPVKAKKHKMQWPGHRICLDWR